VKDFHERHIYAENDQAFLKVYGVCQTDFCAFRRASQDKSFFVEQEILDVYQ
jgi:hypothetical protein